jgi:hypothetical protein
MSDTAREHVKRVIMPWTLKSLLFLIADYHNVKEGRAWPGIKELAEVSGLSERQVRRLLKEICDRYPELIRYTPGVGRGNSGSVEFLKLGKGRTIEPYPHVPPIEILRSLRERHERERRQRLSEAARRGLRDFSKYPLEYWEDAS